MSDLTVQIVPDLDSVDTAAWDLLEHGAAPFLKSGFLRALEHSGSIGREAGWLPVYVLVQYGPNQERPEDTGNNPAHKQATPGDRDRTANRKVGSGGLAKANDSSGPAERASSPIQRDGPNGPGEPNGSSEPADRSGLTRPGPTDNTDPTTGTGPDNATDATTHSNGPTEVENQAAPRLIAGVAAFIKAHSYGEYIFDWSWARASERAGLPYYPKLVVAAPVTPASGPRMLIADDLPIARKAVIDILCGALRTLADRAGCSSIHWLFVTSKEQAELAERGFCPRSSFQFHWHNRGYKTFDDFLAKLTSRRRKQVRKERRRALAAIDGPVEFLRGDQVSTAEIATMDRLYRATTWAHGGQDYLRPGFFEKLCATMPEQVRIARVCQGGHMVAGALYLQTNQALYGRYWGSEVEVDCLHFEVAYYAGVEHCIREGLQLFEAGAQGEHKLLRGFAPSKTYSNHWIREPGLRDAVERFLGEEAKQLESYTQKLDQMCPYRCED
ncbi:MAG: GNAT family N-acetyltransferase [Nannocystaceae bacterium]